MLSKLLNMSFKNRESLEKVFKQQKMTYHVLESFSYFLLYKRPHKITQIFPSILGLHTSVTQLKNKKWIVVK